MEIQHYSIKRRGVDYIFCDWSAAFIRGQCLFKIQFVSCKQKYGKIIVRALKYTHFELKDTGKESKFPKLV